MTAETHAVETDRLAVLEVKRRSKGLAVGPPVIVLTTSPQPY